jgi:hypothetical protein
VTTFPRAPRTLQGGFVLMDADGRQVLRTVAFQYNPDTLTRQLAPRAAKVDSGDRLEALRLTGPPVETLKLDIEFDGTDRLASSVPDPATVENGIAADLAAFETIISPTTADLSAASARAATGTLEILPEPSPLVLLVLGSNRVLPVRVTDVSVVEEAFDTRLNPIRARISLGLRLLSSEDLAVGTKGAELFMAAARRREQLAANRPGSLATLGLTAKP